MNRCKLLFYTITISMSTILEASQTETLQEESCEETFKELTHCANTQTSKFIATKIKSIEDCPEKETILYQYLDEQVTLHNLKIEHEHTHPTTLSTPLISLHHFMYLLVTLPNNTQLHFNQHGSFLYLTHP